MLKTSQWIARDSVKQADALMHEIGLSLDGQDFDYKVAYDEWLEKAEWVQKTVKAGELGRHRADVLRMRIEELEAKVAELSLVNVVK